MRSQAVITDLDGTALDSPKQKVASERLALAVRELERRGMRVCAATGRAEAFAAPVLKSMGLREPCIISGGTRIIDPASGKERWRSGLTEQQMRKIISVLRGKPYGCLWNDYVESDYLAGGWPIDAYHAYADTYFFELCFVPENEIDSLAGVLRAIEGVAATVVVAQRPGMKDLHITNARATKEHAIYELEKLIGAPKRQMIGIGDGYNDLHIFNAVGHKVAMGNAVAELKENADEIIGNVTEDGLAEYFEDLVRKGAEL